MTEPFLQTKALCKTYADHSVKALDGIDLEMHRGEFVSLQGASGSGKSTLLFILASMLHPSGGSLVMDGTEPYKLGSAARSCFRSRHIGLVFQDFCLLPYLDVRGNILSPALAGNKTDPGYADELIERLGLRERHAHKPSQLSTGEQQRVALARTLFARPSIVLADEPTGNLDFENTRIVLEVLREFVTEGGCVLTATHDDSVAETADRHLSIHAGKLV